MGYAMQTPDGAWRVEVVQRGRTPWYRIVHGDSELDWLSIAAVERILTEASSTWPTSAKSRSSRPCLWTTRSTGLPKHYGEAMPSTEERIAARLHEALDHQERADIFALTAERGLAAGGPEARASCSPLRTSRASPRWSQKCSPSGRLLIATDLPIYDGDS